MSGTARPAQRKAGTILLAVTGVVVAATFLLVPPIPQDPAYHRFADTRALFGVPNFWNVATSLAFSVVGGAGLVRLARDARRGVRYETAEWLFCTAVLLVGPGSAGYHLAPDNATLFWDRLPMTVGFMAFTAALLGDTLGEKFGRRALWPLVAVGVVAALYWRVTEQAGVGDLRAYGLVQFLPLLMVPALVAWCGLRTFRVRYLGLALGSYLIAKGAEMTDSTLFELTNGVGGHALKHVLAALACGFVVWLFVGRHGRPGGGSEGG